MKFQRPKNKIMAAAWKYGLAALQPTRSQLEHGLALHARCIACDTFGFLPKLFTKEFGAYFNELKNNNVGAEELRCAKRPGPDGWA